MIKEFFHKLKNTEKSKGGAHIFPVSRVFEVDKAKARRDLSQKIEAAEKKTHEAATAPPQLPVKRKKSMAKRVTEAIMSRAGGARFRKSEYQGEVMQLMRERMEKGHFTSTPARAA